MGPRVTTDIPSWVARFIGIPWADLGRDPKVGLDCYGLIWFVYRREFNIDLPSYSGQGGSATRAKRVESNRLMRSEIKAHWTPVPTGQECVGHAVQFNICGEPLHCGILVSRHKMLHVQKDKLSCVEDFTTTEWVRRFAGCFCYAG